jgi:hypothetical protein
VDDGKNVTMIWSTVYGPPPGGSEPLHFGRAPSIFFTSGNPPADRVFVASDNQALRSMGQTLVPSRLWTVRMARRHAAGRSGVQIVRRRLR